MSLEKQKLIEEIRKINDETFTDFRGWSNTFEAYCDIWSQAIANYVENIVPPTRTIQTAKENMHGALLSSGNVFRGVFEQSLVKFCEGLIIGMNPTFSGILPSYRLVLDSVYDIGLNGGSSEEVAIEMANLIHPWFLSGTAINNNSGVTINWS